MLSAGEISFNYLLLHRATCLRVWPNLGAEQEPATGSRAGSGQQGPSCTAVQPMRPLLCGCRVLRIRYCTLSWCRNVYVSRNICTQVHSSTISNIWATEHINQTAALPKKNCFFCIEKMKQKGSFLGSHASCNLLSCIFTEYWWKEVEDCLGSVQH